MGTISDAKSKMPPPGTFLTQEERENMYRTQKPFFIRRIGQRMSQFKDEKTGSAKEQWILTCFFAEGGDEWQLSLTKNSYRDPLFKQLVDLLATDEFSLRGIGPVKLDKYKAGNGNMAYTIEDWEEPAKAAPAPAPNGQLTAKCVACGETVTGPAVVMGDDRFVAHDCKKDKKKVLLPVSK